MACNICNQEKENLAYIQKEQIEVLRDDRQLKDALDTLGKQEQLTSVSGTNGSLSSTVNQNSGSARNCLQLTTSNQELRVFSEGSSQAGNGSYCEQLLVCKTCRKLIQDYIYHQFSALDIKKNILKVMNENSMDSDFYFNRCRKETIDEYCRVSTQKPSVTKLEVLGSEEKNEKISGIEARSERKNTYKNSHSNIYIKNIKHKRFFTNSRYGKWLRYRKDKRYAKKFIKKNRIRKKKQRASEVRNDMTHHGMENCIENKEMDQLKVKVESTSKGRNDTKLTVEENTSVTSECCPFCKKTVENPGEFHHCSSSSKYLTCYLCFLSLPSLDMVENHMKNVHCLSSDKHCVNEGCNFSCVSEGFLKWHYHLHKLDIGKTDCDEKCKIECKNSGVDFREVLSNREDVIVQILEISDDELQCSMNNHNNPQRNIGITFKDLDMDLMTQIETVVDQSENKCLKSVESSKEVVPTSDKFSFLEITDSEKGSDSKNDILQSDKQRHCPLDVVVCSLCLKSFTSFKDFHKHVETCHSQIHKWKCEHCNKLFGMEKTLMIHRKHCIGNTGEHLPSFNVKPVHINSNEEKAQVLDRNFDADNESLCTDSANAKSSDGQLKMSLCTKLMQSSLPLSDSKTDLHTKGVNMCLLDEGIKKRSNAQKSKIHNCQECGKVFRSYAHLMEHKISHSDTKLYSCNICHKKFKRKNALSKHTRTFHSGKSDLLICQCGKVFTSKDHLESHLHNTDFHQTFSCTFCSASYKTKISLENHLLNHLEDKTKQSWPFTCKICGVKLSSVLSLQTHENLKHGNESWKCEYCSQEFKMKNLLRQHIQRKHKIGEKEYQCHICDKIFYIQKDLKRHANSHNKSRLYKCQMCDATFRTSYGLQSHKRIHSGDRPYTCHICSKTFLLPSHVKSHLASVHSLEVPSEMINRNSTHKCPVCERCFLYRTSLTSHLLSHVGCNSNYSTVMDEDDEEFWENFKDNGKESRHDICVIEVSQNSLLSEESCNTVETNLVSNCKKEPIMTKAIQVDDLFSTGEINLSNLSMNARQSEHLQSRSFGEPSTSAVQKRKTVQVDCEPNDTVSLTNSDSSSFANNESVQQALKDALNVIEVNTLVTNEDSPLITENPLDASESSIRDQEKNMGNASISFGDSNCSFIEVETLLHSVDDVTKYICGNCSKVFTNTKHLKDHLLSCYVNDTSGDYVVVYEEDTRNN